MRQFERVSFTLLFAASCAFAQSARISGRVTDASGSVVPGTSVVVTNAATAAERKVTTNEDGYFTVPLLLPGEYLIAVEHAGFRPISRSGVTLKVDQRAELDFVLEVGT